MAWQRWWGARTGVFPDESSNSMLSAFDVRARLAPRMVHGRIVLLGDAAHEISPIGGQGMNLGMAGCSRCGATHGRVHGWPGCGRQAPAR
ncbi:FAD-dependent monooxygenase [Paenarthrobacter ureafaciens]